MQKSFPNNICNVCTLLFLIFIALPVNAQDICSRDGRAKMRDAAVSEAQIAKVCPTTSATQATKSSGSVPFIDIDDLKLDFASLNGQKIRVKGVGIYMMNMFMLKKNDTDMSPFVVDITKIPREQQRKVLQQCSDFANSCRVTITGTVGKVNFQNGIVAELVD